MRNQRTPGMAILALVLGVVLVTGGVFVAFGARGPQFDRAEEAWGGVAFVAFGLLSMWGGYVTFRRRRPRRTSEVPGVGLVVAQSELRRGSQLTVGIALRPGTPVQDLEVGLVCGERYDREIRTEQAVVRETVEYTAHEQWWPIERTTFVFGIPPDAPYSYEGDCVSYAWRVSARRVRALRTDLRTDHPIWVLP